MRAYNDLRTCLCEDSCATACRAECTLMAPPKAQSNALSLQSLPTINDACGVCSSKSNQLGGACASQAALCDNDFDCSRLATCYYECSTEECKAKCDVAFSTGKEKFAALSDCHCRSDVCQSDCADSCPAGVGSDQASSSGSGCAVGRGSRPTGVAALLGCGILMLLAARRLREGW